MASTDANADLVPLLQVVYSSKDFPTFFDAIQRRAISKFTSSEYNDLARTSTAVMLWHVQAYGLSQLSFNLDRVAADTFLVTSRTLAAATRHTEQLNYKIPPASAATGDFLCAVDPDDVTVQSTLAKGHRFQAPGGRVFLATDEVIVPAASSSFTVPVTEGRTNELSFRSTGTANQRFFLSGVTADETYVADSSVVVRVDGELWTESEFFKFETTNQYEVSYTSDPPEVRFGDGFAGNIPDVDADIVIQYRVISGEDGNIASVTDAATTQIVSSDPFLVAGVPVTLAVTAPTGTSGGTPPQGLEEVKKIAPKVAGSRGVAVTQSDYQALVNSFSDSTFGAVAQGYAADVRQTGNDMDTVSRTDSISSSMAAFVSFVSSTQTSVNANVTTAQSEVTKITSATSDQSSVSTSLSGVVSALNTDATSITSAASSIDSSGSIINDTITLLESEISGSADTSTMLGHTATISSLVNGAGGVLPSSTTVKGLSADVVTQAEEITSQNTSLLSSISSINTSNTAISAAVASISSSTSSLLSQAQTTQVAIGSDITALLAHLDDLFDSDCKANVVNVPILALGVDGFYSGPSSGLIDAVQSYLDGIKEVTQHVNVVSGADALLKAAISITGKISSSFQKSEVIAAVESKVDDLLKGRAFNDPLYLSAPDSLSGLYDVLNTIDGIVHVNVDITSPSNRLDSKGNLIPLELEVVTKGSVTVQMEI